MRAVLWFMALFAVAAASALFAGSNHGTVAVFIAPYRVDLSLNLVVLILVGSFIALHFLLRALTALISIPQQARRWRLQQKERATQIAFLDSISHLISGRFVRARKAAEMVVTLEQSMGSGSGQLPYAGRLRTLAHTIAAESAHAVQDRATRDAHFQSALEHAQSKDALESRDGVQLRAARWAIDDRDATAALLWIDQLPVGAARRTLALRLRFKATRLGGLAREALETVRLLTKHRAFSEMAGRSIARGLAIEMLRSAHDPVQIQNAWEQLDVAEQQLPDVAMEAAERLLQQGGDATLSRQWVLPVWNARVESPGALNVAQQVRLIRVLESGFRSAQTAPDSAWLTRIEAAQMRNPADPSLLYLAGVVCMRLELWGKAQQMLRQSIPMQPHGELKRDAWKALATLAELRGDAADAAKSWKQAAQL